MSTSPCSFPTSPNGPDVLGELLHSLSQPLTSLRCSLELSLDRSIEEVAGQPQATFAVALQQTEKVIGMIGLMREYLDAEQLGPTTLSSHLAATLRNVIEELSSIASVRGVRLCLVGTCAATMPVAESRLRLALQYLISSMIEAQSVGGKVMLLLGEGPAAAVLRVEGEHRFRHPEFLARSEPKSASVSKLRRMRLAIASRVLENVGASLAFYGGDHIGVGPTGFVLRIPHPPGFPAPMI